MKMILACLRTPTCRVGGTGTGRTGWSVRTEGPWPGFRDPDGGEREFKYTLDDNKLVEDVGFFARGANPSAPQRTLTVCGGITTRGVHGAAKCFIDKEMRQRNEQYLFPRFPDGSSYCIVMKVTVVNNSPLTPDLSKPENRLFEWCDASAGTE